MNENSHKRALNNSEEDLQQHFSPKSNAEKLRLKHWTKEEAMLENRWKFQIEFLNKEDLQGTFPPRLVLLRVLSGWENSDDLNIAHKSLNQKKENPQLLQTIKNSCVMLAIMKKWAQIHKLKSSFILVPRRFLKISATIRYPKLWNLEQTLSSLSILMHI